MKHQPTDVLKFIQDNGADVFARQTASNSDIMRNMNSEFLKVIIAPDNEAILKFLNSLPNKMAFITDPKKVYTFLGNHILMKFNNATQKGFSINADEVAFNQANVAIWQIRTFKNISGVMVAIIRNVLLQPGQFDEKPSESVPMELTRFGNMDVAAFRHFVNAGQLRGKNLLAFCDGSKQISLICDKKDDLGYNLFHRILKDEHGIELRPDEDARLRYRKVFSFPTSLWMRLSSHRETLKQIPGDITSYVLYMMGYDSDDQHESAALFFTDVDGRIGHYKILFQAGRDFTISEKPEYIPQQLINAIIPGFKAYKLYHQRHSLLLAYDTDGRAINIKYNKNHLNEDNVPKYALRVFGPGILDTQQRITSDDSKFEVVLTADGRISGYDRLKQLMDEFGQPENAQPDLPEAPQGTISFTGRKIYGQPVLFLDGNRLYTLNFIGEAVIMPLNITAEIGSFKPHNISFDHMRADATISKLKIHILNDEGKVFTSDDRGQTWIRRFPEYEFLAFEGLSIWRPDSQMCRGILRGGKEFHFSYDFDGIGIVREDYTIHDLSRPQVKLRDSFHSIEFFWLANY